MTQEEVIDKLLELTAPDTAASEVAAAAASAAAETTNSFIGGFSRLWGRHLIRHYSNIRRRQVCLAAAGQAPAAHCWQPGMALQAHVSLTSDESHHSPITEAL